MNNIRTTILSQKLKELRKANNYTQDYVAASLGIVRQTYSHYETGKRTPNSTILYKLAGLYQISIDDLMQLTVSIDREEMFDAPKLTSSGSELASYLEFINEPKRYRKYQFLSNAEKQLLYYFEKISDTDKQEIIEFTKIKAKKSKI